MPAELGLDRILVPVDLGPGSETVFIHGLKLALSSGALLTAVHVEDDPDAPVDWTALPQAADLLVRWGVLPAGSAADAVAGLGLHVDRRDRQSDSVAHGLVDEVVSSLPNVLVVGTGARSGLERLRHGSVAESVARRSGAVTLFIPDGTDGVIDPATGEARVERVLFPVGADTAELDHAREVLEAFLDLIDAGDVEVVLVHVGDGSGSVIDVDPDEHRTYTIDLRFGDVIDGLVGAILDHRPDLVAMATHGHDSLMDTLRGSKTEQVLRRSPCPVLAVPVG